MKALVKHASGVGKVDILDVDEPSCGSDQVKVEIAFCGVCGTDIHVMNDTFRNYPPVILGREFAGKAVEKGVKVTDVKLGENVTCLGATAIACGRCQYCVSGRFIFCSNRRGYGARREWRFCSTRGRTPRPTLSCSRKLSSRGGGNQRTICRSDPRNQVPHGSSVFKQLKLCGSVCYTAQTWDRMMKIFQQGRVKVGDLISNKLPISEWRTAFDLCTQKQALKVLMYPES